MSSEDTATKQSPNGSRSTHFHCYLLRSLDPSHPHKSYIGFTTDPKRRLRQHNGDLKNGGARRTRRSGRPWQFVLVVHGFSDQVSALRFEWAWQHPGKSLHVRNAIGDTEAKQLSRRRGTKAALAILKTLLIECTSLCGYHALDLYFLEDKWRDEFSTIKTESGRDIPQSTTCNVVSGVKEMPFWKDHQREKCVTRKKARVVGNNAFSAVADQITNASHWCLLCYKSIDDNKMKCTRCSKGFHKLCLELECEDESDETTSFPQSWTCPVCSTENGNIRRKQHAVAELTCEAMTFGGRSSNHVSEDYEFACEGYVSEDDGSDPQMIYRTAPSFDSDDVSSANYDHGGCVDWDSDNEECEAMSAADSSLDEVMKGVVRQSIADTPRAQSTNDKTMSCDLSRQSPELIDLTMTPSPSQGNNRDGPSDSIPLIDLSQSPDST